MTDSKVNMQYQLAGKIETIFVSFPVLVVVCHQLSDACQVGWAFMILHNITVELYIQIMYLYLFYMHTCTCPSYM